MSGVGTGLTPSTIRNRHRTTLKDHRDLLKVCESIEAVDGKVRRLHAVYQFAVELIQVSSTGVLVFA